MRTQTIVNPFPFGVPVPMAFAAFAGLPPWWMAGWLLWTPAGALAALELLRREPAPAPEPIPFGVAELLRAA